MYYFTILSLLLILLGTFCTCEHGSCKHTGSTHIDINSEENKKGTGKCVSDFNLKGNIYFYEEILFFLNYFEVPDKFHGS